MKQSTYVILLAAMLAACAQERGGDDSSAGDTSNTGSSATNPGGATSASGAASSGGSTANNPATKSCGAGATPVLTSEGIGDFRIGARVAALRAACNVTSDSVLERGAEGMPERRLTVMIGEDPVTATVVDSAVWRIEVRTRRIRTADSLGVGTTLATLRQQPTTFLGYGEGGPFVRVNRYCGLSFDLIPNGPPVQRYEQLPGSATVERILVVGCGAR